VRADNPLVKLYEQLAFSRSVIVMIISSPVLPVVIDGP
jgi:hypothetical protein